MNSYNNKRCQSYISRCLIIIAGVIILALLLFKGDWSNSVFSASDESTIDGHQIADINMIHIGRGNTRFYFNLSYNDVNKHYTVYTDKSTIGEALEEYNLIYYDDEHKYISTVDNYVIPYNGKYHWAFYIHDEYANTDIMNNDIIPDAIYTLCLERN